jgi:hypothetical protein
MKTLLRISVILLAGTAILTSCSKIDEPYYVQKAVYADTNKRAVLVEDYTGHLCVNCASAGKTASSLQELYHGQVFAMGVHAGPFARPSEAYSPYLLSNYANPNSEEWYNYSAFSIQGNPSGMVNRRPWNGKMSFFPADWTSAIQYAVTLPKVAIMTVHSSWNNTSKIATATVQTKFLSDWSGPVTLTVCVLEDSIYGGQLNNDKKTDSVPIIKNYRFMHMFRGSVNGSFGEQISAAPQKSDLISKNYTIDLSDKSWVPAHCTILAFISDDKTKEVLHVGRTELRH